MSKRFVVTCDRCGVEIAQKAYEFRAAIAPTLVGGGDKEVNGDLCAGCSRSLGNWLSNSGIAVKRTQEEVPS